MSEKPLISVILPWPSGSELTAQSLVSLSEQKYRLFEVVIVNSGVPDVARAKCGFDGNLAFVDVEGKGLPNKSAALNAGIKDCSGEILSYLADGDRFRPDHLETIARAFSQSEVNVVYTGGVCPGDDGDSGPARVHSVPFDHDVLLFSDVIPISCLAHRRACLEITGGFDESLGAHEGWELCLRLAREFPFLRLDRITVELGNESLEPLLVDGIASRILERRGISTSAPSTKRAVRALVDEVGKLRSEVEHLSRQNAMFQAEADALERALRSGSLSSGENQVEALESMVKSLTRDLYIKQVELIRLQSSADKSSVIRVADRAKSLPRPLEAMSHASEKDLFAMRMTSTRGWKRTFLAAWWVLLHHGPGTFAKRLRERLIGLPGRRSDSGEYHTWFLKNYVERHGRREAKARVERLTSLPELTLVMPVFRPDRTLLEKAVLSVMTQSYENWQLCIVDDGDSDPALRLILDDKAERDRRIKVRYAEENRGIAAASNTGIEMATGDFIGFLDQDDELPPWALLDVAEALNEDAEIDVLYTDEDKIDSSGIHTEPYFKPDWSPDLLMSHNYTCHLSFYRSDLLRSLGGMREGFEGAQDYDLVLRCIETTDKIKHVPRVCYHWRRVPGSTALKYRNKPGAEEASIRALHEALKRRGVGGEVTRGLFPGTFRVRRHIKSPSLVSIIIPTRDGLDMLRNCLESIWRLTSYDHYEVIIADNGSVEAQTIEYLVDLQKSGRVRVLSCPGPFNFSRLNNHAACAASGELLLFLNNDTVVLSRDWLSAMVEHGVREEVGAVGAKLLYPNGSIQHAGVVTGLGGVAGHPHKYFPKYSRGYSGHIDLIRNFSVVTGACMMTRKKLFEDVDGFEQSLPRAFNDVDYCLKLREKGYLVVYTPYAVLTHLESASRGFSLDSYEVNAMKKRWGEALLRDPYYNPNLTLDREDLSLRP